MNIEMKWVNKLAGWLRNYVPIGRLSYSQEGEDLVLARFFETIKKTEGFFVDIGAHHPIRYSNTYYFYRRGWRGINVDALPGTKKLFERMRPKDITVECGVGVKAGILTYFSFNEPALNTFSEHEAKKKDILPYRMLKKIPIPIVTLETILDENLPLEQGIDFLSIDVEGFDHEVISSNNWGKYRPKIILVEILESRVHDLGSHPTAKILLEQGYKFIAKTHNTYFFAANETAFGSERPIS